MDGRTALDLATSRGHQEVIPLLEQAAHKKGKRKKVKASKKRK
jgi:ankyrin repeat protein